jgi:hypothetical protein
MIECKYKCKCTKEEQTFYVEERNPINDVVCWVEQVVRPALHEHHQKLNPKCRQRAVKWLKIPLPDNADFVGQGERKH